MSEPLDLDKLEALAKAATTTRSAEDDYIAAIDPATVLALVARARRVDELERSALVPPPDSALSRPKPGEVRTWTKPVDRPTGTASDRHWHDELIEDLKKISGSEHPDLHDKSCECGRCVAWLVLSRLRKDHIGGELLS